MDTTTINEIHWHAEKLLLWAKHAARMNALLNRSSSSNYRLAYAHTQYKTSIEASRYHQNSIKRLIESERFLRANGEIV